MTTAQINHYRALWGAARRVLRKQGVPAAECERRRHQIHVEVLGRPVSSLKLSNKQFDLVKGAFLAISNPADLFAQEHAGAGECNRRRHVIGQLCAELCYDDDGLQSVIDRMQSEGRLRDPDRPRGKDEAEEWDIERVRDPVPKLTFGDLDAGELESVIIALRLQVGRETERRAIEHAAPSFAF